MITGEHAVVYGHPAIVAAIDQHITVQLKPMEEPVLTVRSDLAGEVSTPIGTIEPTGPYRFINAAVLLYRDRIPAGLRIDISSDINPTLGLGSSAAVTIAVLAALHGKADDDLHAKALAIVRGLQGRGSGADLAASLWGGVRFYQVSDKGTAISQQLAALPQFSLFNVGYKTPTGEVLAKVAEAQAEDPERYEAIYLAMSRVAECTIAAVEALQWAEVGALFSEYQTLMADLGVSDAAIERALRAANETSGVLGAKISGSGLGDCVLACGTVPDGFVPVKLAQEGVVFYGDG
ncbi:mevalonate kinase family protein [Cognatiyoonia sp.]|uniref:mevalonate kinase family protein n=1 Tax=Cognatiyoonia sp. TaxID=2211652 RepID=UPI003F6A1EE7